MHEIERGDYELVSWAKQHRRMFKRLDAEQVVAAQVILAAFPLLASPSKETPEADPFVVALAKTENEAQGVLLIQSRCVVVTEERRRKVERAAQLLPALNAFLAIQLVEPPHFPGPQPQEADSPK